MIILYLNVCSFYGPVDYIDGGTGSLLLQAAVAGLVGFFYCLRTKFAQIKTAIHEHGQRREDKS